MDIVMPEMDGMMATRQLRAQPGPNAQTPVLAMTAVHQPEDRAACLAAGMQGMVSKPLQANDLLQALADIATHAPPTVETQHTGGAA
jgi:CheY-like chemotaxis protein